MDLPAIQIGMFAAKWSAKRFAGEENPAQESNVGTWDWSSYLKGSLGAVVAGLLGGLFKPTMGQKILEGGLNLMVYKAIQNELISGSEWANAQFGAEEEAYIPDEYEGLLLAGQTPGGEPFMLGEDGNYYPANDAYRTAGYGDELVPVGPLGGSELTPVGPLGETDAYKKAWFQA